MSKPKELESFFNVFEQLEDPRVERTRLYPMSEILLVTICGVAAGCDGWSDIEMHAQQRFSFLRQYQPFEHGIPTAHYPLIPVVFGIRENYPSPSPTVSAAR